MASVVWSVSVSQETFEELERRCNGISRAKFVESLLGIDIAIRSSGVYTSHECIQGEGLSNLKEGEGELLK